jgi:cytochrome c oxidase subunit 1
MNGEETMSTAETKPIAYHAEPKHGEEKNYLNVSHTIRSWLLTLDHKRIAILYLISISIFFAVGSLGAALIRMELTSPRGQMFESGTYNKLFTMHGVIMIFFFLIPSIPATLGNFLIPIMIGARDLAFPRLNLASWYLYVIGGTCALIALFTGGVDTGWTFYTPYSSVYSNSHVVWTLVGVFIAGFSSIATGLNFIVTIHKMRAPGLTWFRLPLFVWAHYATSVIIMLGTPVVAITLLLVVAERLWHIGIFNPTLGGDPVLFQHLFWFYSHPAVYIMILPAMGMVSDILTTFARKPLFGYKPMIYSIAGIAGLGFIVWGHHMFMSGMNPALGMTFMVSTMMIALPSAIKVFNWLGTVWGGKIQFTTPMLFALSFVSMFIIGGLSGIFMAATPVDIFIHDTYFIVGHIHYVLFGGTAFAVFGGIYNWFPKMFGRMMNDSWGKVHFFLSFIFFNGTFFTMHILGAGGFPRRYADPYHFETFRHLLGMNRFMTICALGMGASQLIFVANFFYSLFFGPRVGRNPWHANTLEWTAPSPPGHGNFDFQPIVYRGPYEYSNPESADDYYPQTTPPPGAQGPLEAASPPH